MTRQTTLLTSYKGVDLHAATAVRVMQRRLEGGDALVRLHRCELHTFWNGEGAPTVAELLAIGRYFNPNKHHYGHFELPAGGVAWWNQPRGSAHELAPAWPGDAVAGDVDPIPRDLYDRLLGGPVTGDLVAVDLAVTPLGDQGPLLSGVLWRLVLRPEGRDLRRLAERLGVARAADQGLLVNPHMEGWRMIQRETGHIVAAGEGD